MRILVFAGWFALLPAAVGYDPCNLQPWEPLPAPVRTNGIVASIDLGFDSIIDFEFEAGSDDQSVTYYSLVRKGTTQTLAAPGKRVNFEPEELIGDGDESGYTSFGEPRGIVVYIVSWTDHCNPFGCYTYSASDFGEFATDTLAFVGLRLQSVDGGHFGWVKFVRPCTKAWVPFTLDSYALHPLPNTPIPAGLVPQPELSITHENGQVTLSWPSGWQGWQLEWQPALKPSVAWKPVEGVQNNRVTLPTDWPAAFFRLVKP